MPRSVPDANRGVIYEFAMHRRPLRVIVLMPQGIWRDVSVEIAFALARAAELAGKTLNEGTQAFLAEQFGRAVAA